MVLMTPDRWAMGASIPGGPGLPVGRNPDLAWSVTYTFMDGTDSWIEQCRNGKYFREPDHWILFKERRERILRKKKPPVDLVFYENEHGVLDGNPHEEGYCLATAWAPARSGPISINCLLDMWHAKTVEEGLALAGRMETSWNFVMADTRGNIGYQMSGMMPKRREGISGWQRLVEIIRDVAEYRPPAPRPHTPPRQIQPPRKQPGPLAVGCAVIAGGIGLLLLVGAIGVALQSPQERQQSEQRNMDSDAHYTAEQFIKKQYPGAKSVSGFRDSVVEHEGNVYRVAVNVDGLNAFGGPVRNAMIVEMELNGGTWRLIQIHRK